MKNVASSLGGIVAIGVLSLIVFANLGVIDVKWPWEDTAVMSRESIIEQSGVATVTEIEPLALDCRARIHTTVPIEGRREHALVGQVYRTDTVSITAIGDIDTCVDADEVEVVNRDDGSTRVLIPADAIRFVRPRVDADATLDSVRFDKGFIGKLTDVFPWVSENNGLTPAAYAYAQAVIGSSECMEQAFDATGAAIVDSYEDQVRGAGRDVDTLVVDIIGEPDFATDAPDAGTDVDGYDFTIDDAGVTCSVARDVFGEETAPTGDE